MNRRGFLKAVAAIGGAIAVPDFALILPSQQIAPSASWFATAREMAQYDLWRDLWLVRHDILGGVTQLSISHAIRRDDIEDGIKDLRQISADALGRKMRELGMTTSSLRPLPIPLGYVQPDWSVRV